MRADLVSMVSNDRYFPGEADTLWHARLIGAELNGDELRTTFKSESGNSIFAFEYLRVKKISGEGAAFKSFPSLVMQELSVMRVGIYRHALSDLLGRSIVIYSSGISFAELPTQ